MPMNNSLNSLPEAELEACECPESDTCTTVGYQYTDISIPIDLKPNAAIGTIETECCGKPIICCKEDDTCNTVEITITQKVCIKIPISYNISARIGHTDMNCCDCEFSE